MQLFTENTLTVILPLLRRRDIHTLRNVLRLWSAVLAANVVGALAFAFVLAHTRVVDAGTYEALKAAAIEAAPPP
jgi:formate/nitrite transporter FocA (FNT family)